MQHSLDRPTSSQLSSIGCDDVVASCVGLPGVCIQRGLRFSFVATTIFSEAYTARWCSSCLAFLARAYRHHASHALLEDFPIAELGDESILREDIASVIFFLGPLSCDFHDPETDSEKNRKEGGGSDYSMG